MLTLTEDWGSTLGTAGNYGWVKGTSSWFSAGGLTMKANPTYLSENQSSGNDRAMNELRINLGLDTGTTQQHIISGTNTVIYTRFTSQGSVSLWAYMVGWATTGVEIGIYSAIDTTTTSPSQIAKKTLGTGTYFSGGTLTVERLSTGTWKITGYCAGVGGGTYSGTLQYANATWSTAGSVYPALVIQCIGGTSQIHKSTWFCNTPASNGLYISNGTEYSQTWCPTMAQMPSSLSFQGQQSMLVAYRDLTGSLHAHDTHSTSAGFRCICTMGWMSLSDTGIGQLNNFCNGTECTIACSWGTFNAKYIPATLQISTILDDINAVSVQFLEQETT